MFCIANISLLISKVLPRGWLCTATLDLLSSVFYLAFYDFCSSLVAVAWFNIISILSVLFNLFYFIVWISQYDFVNWILSVLFSRLDLFSAFDPNFNHFHQRISPAFFQPLQIKCILSFEHVPHKNTFIDPNNYCSATIHTMLSSAHWLSCWKLSELWCWFKLAS